MVTIGEETFLDICEREALLDRVMGEERFDKPSEILRRGRLPAAGLALAARDGDRLCGTVRLWHVDAGRDAGGDDVPALLLGPLAVDCDQQGRGTGSRLMRSAIARARELGHGAIILIGDPEYYRRFGFSAAPTTGLVMPKPVDRRRFLGLELRPGALAGARGPVLSTGVPLSLPAAMPLRLAA